MSKKNLTGMFVSLTLFIFVGSVKASQVEMPTVLVVPARYTVVQFGFDIARLRQSVYLVSYDKHPQTKATVMHVWNERAQVWGKLSLEEYLAGTPFRDHPKSVILVGGAQDVPQEIVGVPAWCSDVFRVTNLALVTMANSFHEAFNFNPREWKWLAERYNLEYVDLNAERRRYGRYGKPGSEDAKAQLPPAAKVEMLLEEMPKEVSTPVVGPIEIISNPDQIEEFSSPEPPPPMAPEDK